MAADHSVTDWVYQTSHEVGGFVISGVIGLAVAKRAHVWETVNQIEWRTVAVVIVFTTTLLGIVLAVLVALSEL